MQLYILRDFLLIVLVNIYYDYHINVLLTFLCNYLLLMIAFIICIHMYMHFIVECTGQQYIE